MHSKKFLIAQGNKTMLVWDCPVTEQLRIAKENLNEVEQVGFITRDTNPRLTMMGDELCIDAMLALAKNLDDTTTYFWASGITSKVFFSNTKEETSITVDLPYTKEKNVILFEGIGYLCSATQIKCTKQEIATLALTYSLPAFGIINYQGQKIQPTIYVKKTDSLVDESACGSGSIALFLTTGIQQVTQPSGEIISVGTEGNLFRITANVEQVS